MKFTAADAETLAEILHWRRDVRHFLTDPIPEDIIRTLECAMDFAPSVGNARPWRVIRVDDARLRAGVRANFERSNANAARAYPDAQRDAYNALKLAGLDAAPLQLAIFTATDPKAGSGLGRQTIPDTLLQSTAMAIHTLWLMARACNLGVGIVSILEPERMTELFEAGPGWTFTAYLCIGWPQSYDDMPLLHRQGWQQNLSTHWQRR